LYVGGENGDVWNWNGSKWLMIDTPTNASIENILCADDGKVYILTNDGILLEGRGDKWKIIKQNEVDWYWFENMVWYNDRVYISTERNLFEIKNGVFTRSLLSEHKNAPPSWGKMDALDGILVAGTENGVVLFDGNSLETVFLL
jgi:hypothetical protein